MLPIVLCFCPLFSCAVLSVISGFSLISLGKRELITLLCFLMSFDCECSVSLPHSAIG